MRRAHVRKLLTCAVVSLLPGCLPSLLQQERNCPQPAIHVIGVQPVRECPIPPTLPQASLQVSLPPEPEPGPSAPTAQPSPVNPAIPANPPRATVTQRMAPTDPVIPTELPPLLPPVPVDQLPLPEAPADPALVAAVRAYLGGDIALARKHLGQSRSAPTIATQEELLALLTRLQERDLEKLPSEEAGQLLGRVERLVRVMQSQAPLVLDHLCFCKRIRAYGLYDPLPTEPGFHGGINGQPGERVSVYAEVRNVATSRDGALHVVSLDGTLEILDAQNAVVFRTDFPATPDRSRSPRTDCFVGYEFNIPANLPAGHYSLRVQVRDLSSSTPRRVTQALEFRVVEPSVQATR